MQLVAVAVIRQGSIHNFTNKEHAVKEEFVSEIFIKTVAPNWAENTVLTTKVQKMV